MGTSATGRDPEDEELSGLYLALPAFQPLGLTHNRGHQRARVRRLPAPVGLPPRLWPFDIEVDPATECGGTRQHRDGGLQHPQLSGPVPGHAEGVPEGKLDSHNAWSQLRHCQGRHHRDHDSGNTGTFDSSRQHGHVSTALRSSRREDESVGTLSLQLPRDRRTGFLTPTIQRVVVPALVAHDGDVLVDGTADSTMTFTGRLTSINTALAGMSFAPAANTSGVATLTIDMLAARGFEVTAVTGKAGEDGLGQTRAGLAVGAGVGGTGGQAAGGTPGKEAGDGSAAGVVGVENLGEEDPDGDERAEEAAAEGDVLVAEGLLDLAVG